MDNNDKRGLIPIPTRAKTREANMLPVYAAPKTPLSVKLYLLLTLTWSAVLNNGTDLDLAWLQGQVGALPVFADRADAIAASCDGKYPVVRIEVAPE